jgi:hypothetical protein
MSTQTVTLPADSKLILTGWDQSSPIPAFFAIDGANATPVSIGPYEESPPTFGPYREEHVIVLTNIGEYTIAGSDGDDEYQPIAGGA